MAGRGRGKKGVSLVQTDEPAFIRQFKQKIGYKAGPDVDTKKQQIPDFDEDDDRPEGDDEKPIVVVIRSGDLTEEQAEVAHTQQSKEEDDRAIKEGKITFKKPGKRLSSEVTTDLNPTSSKKQKDSDKKDKKKSESKKVKDSKLLSFDEEDDDDT